VRNNHQNKNKSRPKLMNFKVKYGTKKAIINDGFLEYIYLTLTKG